MAVLTVGAVGSAWLTRVVGLAAARSASFLDNSCFYGHAVSSPEAVQMVLQALGMKDIPFGLAPLLSGPDGFTNEPVFDLPHDRIFVEVSSRKLYTLDGVHVNPMLLRRFFSGVPNLRDAVLRYWGDTRARQAYMAALADDPEMREATADEIWILNNISVSLIDDDRMTLDFRRLHAMLGNRMVIVAPANLRNASEVNGIKYLAFLRRISEQLGVPFLDAGQSIAAARSQFNAKDEHAEAAFQSYSEAVTAQELIEKFIDPAKQLIKNTVELDSSERRRPRRRWKFFRPAPVPAVQHSMPWHEPDPRPHQYLAGNAAWVANWTNVRVAASEAVAAGDRSCETARLGFRAAWYSNEVAEALQYFAPQAESGRLTAAELLEGVEVAFQSGSCDDAIRWAVMAIAESPALAEPAFRLAQLHGYEDRSLELLEAVAAAGEPAVELINLLHRDSAVKRQIAKDMLSRWSGEPVQPNAEGLLLLALRGYEPGADADRARDILRWCNTLSAAEQMRPLAARALTRALNAALNAVDFEREPAAAQEIAAELIELEPANAKAVTFIAQLRDAEGRFEEAAVLLERLAFYHPGSAALQAKRINQWLKAKDFLRVHHAVREADALHQNNQGYLRLRARALTAIEQYLRAAPPSEREKFGEVLTIAGRPE